MFDRVKKAMRGGAGEEPSSVDPVCGMSIQPGRAAASRSVNGRTYQLCSASCVVRFDADPARYAVPATTLSHHHSH